MYISFNAECKSYLRSKKGVLSLIAHRISVHSIYNTPLPGSWTLPCTPASHTNSSRQAASRRGDCRTLCCTSLAR
jgi:hypothetical protein